MTKVFVEQPLALPGSAKEPNLAYCWFSQAYVFLPIHIWTNKY